jgi:hypothetical protein
MSAYEGEHMIFGLFGQANMMGFFEKGSCELFAWAGLRTEILLISASLEARITGVSHWCPAYFQQKIPFVASPHCMQVFLSHINHESNLIQILANLEDLS